MSAASTWLEQHTRDAPERLRRRMLEAVTLAPQTSVQAALAEAALSCLESAIADPTGPQAAVDLLGADALLTHACAAAAEQGEEELIRFTTSLDAGRFQQLLERA